MSEKTITIHFDEKTNLEDVMTKIKEQVSAMQAEKESSKIKRKESFENKIAVARTDVALALDRYFSAAKEAYQESGATKPYVIEKILAPREAIEDMLEVFEMGVAHDAGFADSADCLKKITEKLQIPAKAGIGSMSTKAKPKDAELDTDAVIANFIKSVM